MKANYAERWTNTCYSLTLQPQRRLYNWNLSKKFHAEDGFKKKV